MYRALVGFPFRYLPDGADSSSLVMLRSPAVYTSAAAPATG